MIRAIGRWLDQDRMAIGARAVGADGETMAPGAVVCEVARRYGGSQSLIFYLRRQARTERLGEAPSVRRIGPAGPTGPPVRSYPRSASSSGIRWTLSCSFGSVRAITATTSSVSLGL